MRKLFFGFMAISAMLFTACDDDDDDTTTTTPSDNLVAVSGKITSDQTWTKDNVYRLDGRVFVTGGATLTIEPGTIIKAAPGTGAFASALIINRDGNIQAEGTAAEPIIFTSIADNIQPGQIASPNLTPDNRGLWGGVIILGEAQISAQNDDDQDVSELQIEGVPTSEDALYGGSNDADNSGVFAYVSIRHGGSNIGAGNEINGLSLGGIGSGTRVENIEIVANADDGIEWFGGTVDVSNVLIWNSGDDGLDTDQDWIGTCDDFIIVNPTGSAFELDGPEGTLIRGNHQFNNGTIYAGNNISDLVDWDDNTNAGVSNVYFYGLPSGYKDGVSSFGGDGSGTNSGWEYTLNDTPADSVFQGVPSDILTEVTTQNANTVGHSANYSWTWASQSGALGTLGL